MRRRRCRKPTGAIDSAELTQPTIECLFDAPLPADRAAREAALASIAAELGVQDALDAVTVFLADPVAVELGRAGLIDLWPLPQISALGHRRVASLERLRHQEWPSVSRFEAEILELQAFS